MMDYNKLPPAKKHISETLVVTYKDGSVLKVPYFDHKAATSFLSLEEGVVGYEVVPYADSK